MAEVALRALLCGLGTLVAIPGPFFSVQKKASYTDTKAMVFVVAVAAVATGYSMLQVARCCVALAMSKVLEPDRA